jgi:fatty-acyl-CoA synthase
MFSGDLVAERARLTPDRLALVSVETGARITYRELEERVAAAARLVRQHVPAGGRYGILAFNCVEFLELFFAAGRIGCIAVPLSTRATAHEIRGIVADCAMSALFFGAEFAAHAAEVRDALGDAQVTLPVDAVRPELGDYDSPEPRDEDIWCLLYTSGTTGKPKGVMIPRRQLFWNGYNTAVNWSLREEDVSSIYTPLYHAGGVAAFLIPIFTVGGTIVIHKGFEAAEVWRTIERERCTVVLGVPTIFKLLLDAPELATTDLTHVRWFISGGAPLPQYLIDAYQQRGVVFKQGYGMTEVGVNCFSMTIAESFRKPGSIGRPMLFTAARLVDAEGHDVARGEIGELWLRGPHVSSGYWQQPEATRIAFGDDGFLRTGDLARQDDEGFFYIAGRRKEMFISGGVNVYPAEIEAELVAHPDVSDAAIVPRHDDTWGEVAIAFVVIRTGARLREEELSAYLAGRLAKYKLPRRYHFLDVLPRSPYGKVEKARLAEQFLQDQH